jgi:putative membrane protein
MTLAAYILILLIAVFHFWFLVLEMFLWTKPTGLRVFRQSLEKAQNSAVLAANQGLYNGFLAAGLIWGLLYPNPAGQHILTFFLICVAVAGIYGAYSVSRRIFWIQAFPALLALGLLWIPRLQEQLL